MPPGQREEGTANARENACHVWGNQERPVVARAEGKKEEGLEKSSDMGAR
jgi:hypothetical protein